MKHDPLIHMLLEIAAMWRLTPDVSSLKYGWGRKSVGLLVVDTDSNRRWLRLASAEGKASAGPIPYALEEAQAIQGVPLPRWLHGLAWEENHQRWRADLMEYVSGRVLSSTAELRTPISVPDAWYVSLHTALARLALHSTDRIGVRQDLINRRIGERFGTTIDTSPERWTTAHGDIHWANLVAPTLVILDWERWGMAPSGLDSAFLLCFSLLVPATAAKIQEVFSETLRSNDGVLSQLFAIAELLRMIELYGDHPDLREPLELRANALLPRAKRR